MQITLKQVSGEWASCLPQAGKHFEVPRRLLREELKPRREEMRCPPPPPGGGHSRGGSCTHTWTDSCRLEQGCHLAAVITPR